MTLAPGFLVFHSNQLEFLSSLLTHTLARHPLGPLEPDVIMVQSNGMKHWLELQLAHDDALGICAATPIDLPSTVIWRMYRAVLGADRVSAHMPLDEEALVWRVLRLLHGSAMQDPVYAPLHRYLHPEGSTAADPRKAYQLAQQLADVLDGYQNYRADWLADWAAGHDRLRRADGQTVPLPPEHSWQAALWRRLLHDLAEQGAHPPELSSRASVHAAFLAAVQQLAPGERPPGVPARLVVFGVSALPLQNVQALAALGRITQVLMFVTNPCQEHWAHVVEDRRVLTHLIGHGAIQRDNVIDLAEDAWHTDAHPLLAAWGQQARDYLHLIDCFHPQGRERASQFLDPAPDAEQRPEDFAQASQLAQLQSDILHLRPLPATPRVRASDDHSMVLVSCHSAQREVEVLHDQVLAWLQDQPQLQARDIMVMVPDLQVFAPHIQAAWGRFAPGDPRHIPFHLADATVREQPLVQALERLLQLPSLRLTLDDALGLFEVEAVRAAFDLDVNDIDLLQAWLADSGLRWGLDAAHRTQWGMAHGSADADHNTWAFALRRLLLGYAVGAPHLAAAQSHSWQGQVPTPGIGGMDAQLIGKLLDWLGAITHSLHDLQAPRTPVQWQRSLQALVQRFFTPVDEAQTQTVRRMLDALDHWTALCEESGLEQNLDLVVVRDHWLDSLQASALHQRFLGDGVQFATLMPMRSIPFRIICLLGMNDGAYPRPTAPRDFDLLADSAWRRPADRSRREDDRYLFLEALLSARERLYISWQGRRTHDHEPLPPSVLVGQLIDHLRRGWTAQPDPVEQPLQAFSLRYLMPHAPFQTFAQDWVQALHAAPAAAAPTPDEAVAAPSTVPVQALRQFMRQPLEVFYGHRLGIRWAEPQEEFPEDEPFALDGLQQYQAVLQALRNGTEAQTALRGTGILPLAGFGQAVWHDVHQRAQQLIGLRAPWLDANATPMDAPHVQLELGPQQQVQGELASGEWWQLASGQCLHLDYSPSRVFWGEPDKSESAQVWRVRLPKIVGLWVEHLCACASGYDLCTVLVGVDGCVSWATCDAAQARAQLAQLFQRYQQAWRAPLPLACESAGEWLTLARHPQLSEELRHSLPWKQARMAFEDQRRGRSTRPGEHRKSPVLRRHFDDFDALAPHLPELAPLVYGPVLASAQCHAPAPREAAA